MAPAYDTIVAGIGGMGSAALYHLAKRGQRVLGLERFEIGHAQGSSHGESRLIRFAYFEGSNYVPIVQRAWHLWADLGRAAGIDLIHRTGSLEMSETDVDFTERARKSCLDHDLPHEMLDHNEIVRRFPAFHLTPGTRALYQPDGGFILCEDALRAHVALAVHHGAVLQTGERVLGFRTTVHGGIDVTTDRATYTAGRLIVTAGPWMQQLIPQLASSLTTSKHAVAWFRARDPAPFRLGAFPVFIHFSLAGEFYGFPEHGPRGIKIAGPHYARVPVDPDQPDRTAEPAQIAALQGFLDRHIPALAGSPTATSGCIYTATPDEHFVIDTLPEMPQVLAVSACSGHGYKFASAIGEIAADLVTKGRTWADLTPFALARFAPS